MDGGIINPNMGLNMKEIIAFFLKNQDVINLVFPYLTLEYSTILTRMLYEHYPACNSKQNCNSNMGLNTKEIIAFFLKNRDVSELILPYITVEYEVNAKMPPLMMYCFRLFQKKELKNKILSEYHTCEVILTLKKILQETILGIKNDGRWARKIIRIFKRTKFKKRKQNFYEIAKTKIESKLLVAIDQKVSDYILIDDLRYSLLLLDKIIEIYKKKNFYLRTLQTDISWMLRVLSLGDDESESEDDLSIWTNSSYESEDLFSI